MSRIGKKPIVIPTNVNVIIDNNKVFFEGPLGKDSCEVSKDIKVVLESNIMNVSLNSNNQEVNLNAMQGLYRSLLANVVIGVSTGYERELTIIGVGYKALQKGKDISLNLGFSHSVDYFAPEGITLQVVDPTHIKIKGINKQSVGQVAAEIRKLKPPEPYKGKGIKYNNENILRKAGKTGKK